MFNSVNPFKSYSWFFFITDAQTDGRRHKLHTKQITPLPCTGTGRNLLYPILYLSQNGVRLLCLLTLFCWDKIIFTNYIIWRLFKTFNHKCVRYKIGWSSRFEYPMIYNSSKSELWLLFVPVIPVFLIPPSNPRRFKKRVSHYTLYSIKHTGLVNKNSTFHFTKTKHQATAKLCQSFVPAELI